MFSTASTTRIALRVKFSAAISPLVTCVYLTCFRVYYVYQARPLFFQRLYSTAGGVNSLLLVEHKDGKIAGATLNALSAANKLGGSVTALVAGDAPESVAQTIAKYKGVSKVLTATDAAYAKNLPEDMAPLLAEIQKKYGFTHLVAGHTAVGKNVMPRVAALLDVAPVSDITGVEAEDTFVRPIYAGKEIAVKGRRGTVVWGN